MSRVALWYSAPAADSPRPLFVQGERPRRSNADVQPAWVYAQQGGRAGAGRVIVEGFVPFDFEITLLTVRHRGGTSFCEPIGHYQEDGDYRESWQPQPMSPAALKRAQEIARAVTDNLGGWGVFGVELFVRSEDVLFSEVSPRPHDTGLVTLVSQDLSQFALHVRAILGLPIPAIRQRGPSASVAVLAEGDGSAPRFYGVEQALSENLGLFSRLSWNDGATETWAFTQIDQSFALGAQFDGALWGRTDDAIGIAGVVNGISADHRDYLAAGGLGFIIGDGALQYAPETILEAYYRFQVLSWLQLSADYQFVVNPAYNQSRGPVNVFSFRTHLDF
mgnify:CR=1 FL=1